MKKLYIFIFVLLLISCKKKEEEAAPATGFDNKAVNENIADNRILPDLQKLNNNSDSLVKVCDAFGGQPTEANLILVQELWKKTSLSWMQCQVYNFGPMSEQLTDLLINTWPSNFQAIETAIANTNPITSQAIEGKSSTAKGLKAMEYLLFSRTNGNTFIVQQLTSNGTARKDYLTALAENINKNVSDLNNTWKNNYHQIYKSSNGNGVSSSLPMLTNQLIQLTDIVAALKIGTPAGKISGTPEPQLVESGESNMSLELIKSNIKSIENVYKGIGINGINGAGLDDLLNQRNARYNNDDLLSNEIDRRFNHIYSKMDNIQLPLQDAISSNPEQVEELYQAVKNLLLILKVDLTSALGITITFTDTDGD